MNEAVASRSSTAALATVIWPVAALIAKRPPVLPPVIVQFWNVVAVTSPSVAATVPTAVPLALFSATLKLWPAVTTGVTSLTSVRLTVTVWAAEVHGAVGNGHAAG